jgi:hypothetical protein
VIRQRFSSGRLARIGAWALAAVTSIAAVLNGQMAASATDESGVGPEEATADQFVPVNAPVPTAPAGGLLILRYEPSPLPPPPTIVRRVIVEERVAGAAGSTPTATRPAATAGATASASSAAPPPPPPAPAPLPPAPPVQSSGS